MNVRHKSIGNVIFSVLNNPLCQELTFDEAADYTLDFIRLLGAPLTYIDKIEKIKLSNYKAKIPCDVYYIKSVRVKDGTALRYASNNFHLVQEDKNCIFHNEFTYIIQKDIIFTSIENEELEISYKAIETDKDGYPLIPDNEKLEQALKYYILWRYLEPLWMMGKITDKSFEYVQQQYSWYVGGADSSMRNTDPDYLETVMNGVNRIIRNTTLHENSYSNLGEKEYIKKY